NAADRVDGLKYNPDTIGVGESAIGLDRFLDERSHLDPSEIEIIFAGFQFLDIENVVDKSYQPLAIPMRDPNQVGRPIRQIAGGLAHEKAERPGNRRQWRAQFVTHR